jgi:hypothetical protein
MGATMNLQSQKNQRRILNAIFVVLSMIVISLSSRIVGDFEEAVQILTGYRPAAREIDLPTRIQTLTRSLNSAAETVGQIEAEISKRQALVAQLQKDAETASKISALNKEQLEAVAQVLRSEIKNDQSQNFWSAQVLAFFYAALGVALSEGYRFIARWRLRRKLQVGA